MKSPELIKFTVWKGAFEVQPLISGANFSSNSNTPAQGINIRETEHDINFNQGHTPFHNSKEWSGLNYLKWICHHDNSLRQF